MKHPGDSILQLPITATGVSEQFTKAAVENGYNTLADILAIPLTDLIKFEWFSPSMFEELSRIVQNTPGSSSPKE